MGDLVWQAQRGAWTVSVCVKGTFELRHEREAVIADVQEPLAPPRYAGDDPAAALLVPGDVVPFKPRTDVLVLGSAHAPEGRPVDALVVRVSVGELSKAIGVVGNRVWRDGPDGLEPSPPEPFTSLPIVYERAARGRENPVGVDLTAAPVAGRPALPNLEAVDDAFVDGRVVGLGALSPRWPSRRALVDDAAARWLERMETPLPDGFDFGFFNAAPADQQLALLRHGATIVLENLNREHPRIETRLPLVRPKAFLVTNDTERASEIALRCDTVIIDAERAVAMLVWRGLAGIERPDANVTIAVATESPRKRLDYRHIERMLQDGTSSSLGETLTQPHDLGRRHDAVKSRPTSRPAPFIDNEATPLPPSWSVAPAPADPWEELTTAKTNAKALGFRPPSFPTITSVDLPKLEDVPTIERDAPPRRGVVPDLGVADHARIAVALERGQIGRVLTDLGVGLAELAEAREAWKALLAEDEDLARAYEMALTAARIRPGS
ncbi:MAG TPA: DUF2169 domain-containing protein [Minicystis sp.]|nr:DUF2169 domain-containing protein [Minicystis sp.]